MKRHRALVTMVSLMVMTSVFIAAPQSAISLSEAFAKELPQQHKIIADTLAAHKVTCLSRDGVIRTVLLDGKWIVVNDVELTDHTLILRTDVANISLTAVHNIP